MIVVKWVCNPHYLPLISSGLTLLHAVMTVGLLHPLNAHAVVSPYSSTRSHRPESRSFMNWS